MNPRVYDIAVMWINILEWGNLGIIFDRLDAIKDEEPSNDDDEADVEVGEAFDDGGSDSTAVDIKGIWFVDNKYVSAVELQNWTRQSNKGAPVSLRIILLVEIANTAEAYHSSTSRPVV